MEIGYNTGGMDVMFTIVPIFTGIVFVVVLGMMIFSVIQNAKKWNTNNHSPKLTVDATIVSKRMDVHHYHNHGTDHTMYSSSTSTTYYVTFQVESGDRMELRVPVSEYGYMVEGDKGKITFQGTRFLEFKRC